MTDTGVIAVTEKKTPPFRNGGHTGECFFFLLPPLRGRECPGSLPNRRFGRVGKGGGFFFEELHPHPNPLPGREREKHIEGFSPFIWTPDKYIQE